MGMKAELCYYVKKMRNWYNTPSSQKDLIETWAPMLMILSLFVAFMLEQRGPKRDRE